MRKLEASKFLEYDVHPHAYNGSKSVDCFSIILSFERLIVLPLSRSVGV